VAGSFEKAAPQLQDLPCLAEIKKCTDIDILIVTH